MSISKKRINLLILEDSLPLRELLLYIFDDLGIYVETATTVNQAIKLLDIYLPHLVICDLELPVETGYTFIHRLMLYETQHQIKIPVIAISALNDEIEKIKALRAGFSAFLGKPFDYELLVDKVYQLVGVDSYKVAPQLCLEI